MENVCSSITVALIVGALVASPSALAGNARSVPAPFGEYAVVAVRNSNKIVSTTSNQKRQDWFGRTVEFGLSTSTWLNGEVCSIWSVREAVSPDFILDDRNLSDLTLAPFDVGPETIDRRLNVPVDLVCNDLGERVIASFVIIDRRVLLVPTVSRETYVILEKLLSSAEISRFQIKLKEMKFYDGAISGTLNSETIASVGSYAEYRGAGYRFPRTAITENLLDRLGVLDE
jgi:hypothetical protein